jgi:hypothetical protein
MKKLKLPILGLGLLLAAVSCKKTDVLPTDSSAVTAKTASIQSAPVSSEWKTLANWSSASKDKFTAFNTKISDSSISNAVTSNGLVLVFKKDGNTINSLPYQDKTSNSYWYYQISAGTVQINCDSYSTNQSVSNQSFTYFVLSPSQVKDLETKGHSKMDLMQLTYDNAASLLKK